MAPPSDKPKLCNINPQALALQTARVMRNHLDSQLTALAPRGKARTTGLSDDDLRLGEIYRAASMLAGYARGDHDLEAPVDEHLNSLTPLFSAAIGYAPTDGLDYDVDPKTDLGTVLAAAIARDRIEGGQSVSTVQLAALASLSLRAVQQLVAKGEIGSEDDGVPAKVARRWLASRGVLGFDRSARRR